MEFKCKPAREVFSTDNFKIYGCRIDVDKYPELKLNNYDMITIKGNFQKLDINVEYDIIADEIDDKYGVSYQVKNIKRPKILNISDAKNFLNTVTSEDRANAILEAYPNVIDMIMNNKYNDINTDIIKGVGKKTLEKIKEKIEVNYKYIDVIDKFSGIFSYNTIIKLGEKYPSIEKIEEELCYRPYDCLCKVDRIGFKTADNLLLSIEKQSNEMIKQNKTPKVSFGQELSCSYQRLSACINHILTENELNGNTYMNFKKLFDEVKVLVPEAYTEQNLKALQEESSIIFIKDLFGVAKKSTLKVEKAISEKIKEAIDITNIWDIDYSKYKIVGDIELSDEQFSVLDLVCNNNIMILNGFAGAGKSQTIKSVVSMCDDNKKTYALLSTTGKASKVLADFTNKNAGTIHRKLGITANGKKKDDDFMLSEDIVIVDEFGMCDIYLFNTLLSSIDFKKTKLLLVGDSAQLPSVGAGNLLNDLLNGECVNKVTLSKIFRYNSNGLLNVATDMRNGKKYIHDSEIMSNNRVFSRGNDKDYVLINVPKHQIINQVEVIYNKLIENGNSIYDLSVLTAYNKGEFGTIEINKRIQSIVNINCKNNSSNKFSVGNIDFYVGDLVIQKKNNYKANVYDPLIDTEMECFVANGDTGVVKEIFIKGNTKHIVIEFDGVKVDYTSKEMTDVRLGYSISIHSSQGSSIKIPILITPSAHTFMLNSNLLYVGCTRAKHRCYHITDKLTTVNSCVKKKADFSRNTMLNYFLKN